MVAKAIMIQYNIMIFEIIKQMLIKNVNKCLILSQLSIKLMVKEINQSYAHQLVIITYVCRYNEGKLEKPNYPIQCLMQLKANTRFIFVYSHFRFSNLIFAYQVLKQLYHSYICLHGPLTFLVSNLPQYLQTPSPMHIEDPRQMEKRYDTDDELPALDDPTIFLIIVGRGRNVNLVVTINYYY